MATVTTPDTVEVVRHRAADQEDIFRLYAETFGQDLTEGSRRRWHWQYPENPARESEGPAIWVAREGVDVLGQYASMPVRLWWDGREVRSSWGMDVFVRPQARGKGVGARLFTAWSDHVEVALGLGLTPSSYGLFKKLRYHDVGPVPFFQKVLDARAVASRRLGPVLGAIGGGRCSALGWSVRHPERPRRLERSRCEPITAFGPEYDALWERARGSYAMCVRRDAAYLDWKYARCPHRSYDAARGPARGARSLGFAVSRHAGVPRAAPGLDRGRLRRRRATTTPKDALIGRRARRLPPARAWRAPRPSA